ncbi:hypothetical protein [Hyalangium sp.]|uniref:hypothetical protein n=1 Tax=Hyalangium sp. TaxID=2028555 RepID=UPI002D2A44EA|nr:hypothetical protein [Hyalangium sp.]HYH98777.1 hypothetical protein [Hyalangium sp.]
MLARERLGLLGAVLVLAMAGCIPEAQLQPRPDARSLAGEPSAAIAETAGVRLIADGAAWSGHPGNLERRLTPVEVRMENHSGRPLSIRYNLFDLVGESRFHYAALSPMLMEEANDSEPRCVATYVPRYSWQLGATWGWGPRRGWRGGYPGRPWWQNPYYDPFYDPFYGPRSYVRCEEPLPTQDMLARALPEGSLESGGTVDGFLYFQGVADRERQVILQARLVDGNTGEPFGELRIPFQVRRD